MCMIVISMFLGFVILSLQSLNESQVPDALLERLVSGQREFPPVCSILGGILGQVLYLFNYSLLFLLLC